MIIGFLARILHRVSSSIFMCTQLCVRVHNCVRNQLFISHSFNYTNVTTVNSVTDVTTTLVEFSFTTTGDKTEMRVDTTDIQTTITEELLYTTVDKVNATTISPTHLSRMLYLSKKHH